MVSFEKGTLTRRTILNEYIQANTNGRLHDAAEPSISALDRSFLYGDSIYEVWRTYGGVIFAYQEHWDRLRRSASALHIKLPFDESVLLTEIRRTVSAFFEKTGEDKDDVYVRLQVSRGAGAIGLDPALADEPAYVMLVQKLNPQRPDIVKKGLTLSLAKALYRNHPKTVNPAWKTGNYLNNLLCLREAKSRGADDALIMNLEGAVAEASVSNIFFVSRGEILTPPADSGILEGITRRILLDQVAKNWDYDMREETIYAPQLADFSECFLTSTTRDIVPVGRIDKIEFQVGPKTVTAKLKKIFRSYVKEYCERSRELRIL